ncbi:MAG: restriction endonuclease subunit S [Paludibacteraceae bacterium]|nr:restriction endonuclease subunit S [Paludibacteraceae bacterium]
MTNKNSTYKRLGDYIREISVRNKDLSVTKLMGINIDKYFMPSVANVIGTDMSNYKVVANGQFACNLMHVGRDEKIPVALNTGDSIIVSPAYFVFEVCDNTLLPEYLELSLRNPEFDRNAWFHTDGDVRGGMDKEGMKDLLIPVPPLEEQRSIVSRYKAIETRISTNKQTIAKLEEAAQALYRKMFVDGTDCKKCLLSDLALFQEGYVNPPQENLEYFDGEVKWLRAVDVNESYIFDTSRTLTKKGFESAGKSALLFEPNTIAITKSGTIGRLGIISEYMCGNRAIINIKPKDSQKLPFVYLYLQICKNEFEIIAVGSAQKNLYVPILAKMEVIRPNENILEEFCKKANTIFCHIKNLSLEIKILTEMLSLVMA